MKSMIEELWFGNISMDAEGQKITAEEKRLLKKIVELQESLNQRLGEEEKKLFEAFSESYGEYTGARERAVFKYAFALGGRIAIETMSLDT